MRILVLTSSYPKFAGDSTAPFIEQMVLATARLGHEIDVVLPRHPELVLEGRAPGVPVRFFPYGTGFARGYAWGYASSMQADRKLRVGALIAAPLAFLSALRRAVALGASRRYDLVHAQWVLPSGAIAAAAAARLRLPLVVSAHGSDVFVAESGRVFAAAARTALHRSRWTVACSRDLAERCARLAGDGRVVDVLPYGVDLGPPAPDDAMAWRARLGVGQDEFLVVGLGRLVAKKGFSTLLRAVAQARRTSPSFRLAIAGGGDLAGALTTEARALGCGDGLALLGDVPHDAVGALLGAADVVAVPSVRDDEGNVDGLPNVLLEALAVGRPVVASRVGGIPDVILDGENGLLVPPGDAETLAAALVRLAGDAELRGHLVAGARRAAAELPWERYAERLIAGYERVIAAEAVRAH